MVRTLGTFVCLLILLSSATLAQETKTAKPTSNEQAAREILEKYVAVIGGQEALDAVKTVETLREVEAFGSTSRVLQVEDKATRRYYQRTEGAQGVMESGYDGTRLWRKSAFFKGYLPDTDPFVKNFRNRDPEPHEYLKNGRTVIRLENEKIDNVEYLVVQSTEMDEHGREFPTKFYFDPTTYLLKRRVSGTEIQTVFLYDDFRKTGDLVVAYSSIVKTPQATITTRIKELRNNIKIDEAKFAYPEADGKEASSVAPNMTTPPATAAKTEPLKNFAPDDDIPETLRVETFEAAWKIVNETYYDPTFNGKDWKGVHDAYLPKAKATTKSGEFHKLLNQMVGEIQQSHFKITPPDKVQGLHSQGNQIENGVVGLEFRWIDRQILVTRVENEYPAAAAGVGKGWVLLKIDGKTPDDIFDEAQKEQVGHRLSEAIRRVRAASAKLNGKPDTKVVAEFLDGNGKTVALELVRKKKPAGMVLDFESKRLPGDIGYIRISIFFGEAVEKFREAMRSLSDAKGLILDLRGNPGGVGTMSTALSELLFEKEGTLGVSTMRFGNQNFGFKGSGENAFKGKLVILVDELTGSTSEVLTAGLRENNRALVVGMPTAGAVLPSVVDSLPTGATFQHVISNFQTPSGKILEGAGITPDFPARFSRKTLLENRDPALERAAEILNSK